MLRNAKREVVIANAYFFPGYRLLREMRNAAQRGVRVVLIVQGEPDMAIVKVGAQMLYNYLVKAGVEIYEYCLRPLHGKWRPWTSIGPPWVRATSTPESLAQSRMQPDLPRPCLQP